MSVSTVRQPANTVGGRRRGIARWPERKEKFTARFASRLTCTVAFPSLQRFAELAARRARQEIADVTASAIEAAAKTLRAIDAWAVHVRRRCGALLPAVTDVETLRRDATAVMSSTYAGVTAWQQGAARFRFAGFSTPTVVQRLASAWIRAVSAVETWVVAQRRAGLLGARRRLTQFWRRTAPAIMSGAVAAIAGLQAGVFGVRRSLVGFQERTILATKTQALIVTATLSCGSRGVRVGIAEAYRQSAAESRSFVSAASRVLQRGGHRGRTGVAAAWGGTVETVDTLRSVIMRQIRRGVSHARSGIRVARRRIVSVVKSTVSAVRGGVQRGGRVGQAGWNAAVAAVSSSLSFLLAAARDAVRLMRANLAAAMRPRTPPLEGVVFEVVRGLHDGVRVMLESGSYRIGCTAEADIVLRDPGVMPGHAVLGVQRGNIRLEATGDDVGIGTRTVMKGHGCRLRLPLELSIGEACLRLSQVEARSAGRSRLAIAGIAVASVCAVALLALGFLREEGMAGVEPAPAPPTRVASSDPAAGLPAPEQNEREQIADPAMLERIRQELTAHIKDAKIRTLRVTIADGGLAVSGILGARDRTSWSDVQYWFDQTYRARVALTTNFTESKPPNLQLRAVWFGDRPYVITAQGQHFNQGAILDDGWTLQEIGQDHLLLAKDGDTQPFPYR